MSEDRAVFEGITDTFFDYAESFDQGDVNSFADLFIEGCLFDESTKPRDREWVLKRATRFLEQFEGSSHHISNIRLRWATSTEAQATAYVYAWQRRRGGGDIEGWGRYDSLFRFDGPRWRFAHHRILVAGMRGGEAGPLAPAQRASWPQ